VVESWTKESERAEKKDGVDIECVGQRVECCGGKLGGKGKCGGKMEQKRASGVGTGNKSVGVKDKRGERE
jgi:hypothetical protein